MKVLLTENYDILYKVYLLTQMELNMKLVFEKREVKVKSHQKVRTPKYMFVNSLMRQKLAFHQIVTEGKKNALDEKNKNIRPLWYLDPADGIVRLRLKYGVRELIINEGNVLRIGKLGAVPDFLDSLIAEASKGTFDVELQKVADALKSDRAAAKAAKAAAPAAPAAVSTA